MSSFDSNYIQINSTNDIDSDDSNDNDNSGNADIKDALDKVLPIDIACQKQKQPTESNILVLTNALPPIHFLFLLQCY